MLDCCAETKPTKMETGITKSKEAQLLIENLKCSNLCVWPAVLHRKVFPVDSVAAFNKGAGRFVIDGGQGANVADELIQQGRLDQVRLLWDQGLLWQHHLLGGHRVGGQQAPINVAPVTQVRVVRVLQRTREFKTSAVNYSYFLGCFLGFSSTFPPRIWSLPATFFC